MESVGKRSKWSTVGAILVLVAFFLPWANVSCVGAQIGTISGLQTAAGVEPLFAGESKVFLAPLVALSAMVLPFLLKSVRSAAKVQLWLVPVTVGILAGLYYAYVVEPQSRGQVQFTEVQPAAGFWLTLIGFVMLWVGSLSEARAPKPETPPEGESKLKQKA